MSRWDTSQTTAPRFPVQNAAVGGYTNNPGVMNFREVYQHGTAGNFLTRIIEEPPSQFIKCVYQDKYLKNETVTILCEKRGDCCEHGCCPKDQFWMAGVFVLLAFVLLVAIVGACLTVICYQRSKSKQRRMEKEVMEYNNGSQIGMYPPNGYSGYSVHESTHY